MTTVYNMHGKVLHTSRNLRGLLEHYRRNPSDVVVKVADRDGASYCVTVFWPNGDEANSVWADWRVLLDWLKARRSWSINRVTFDAPLYDRIEPEGRFDVFRKSGINITRHAYAK
jgi:hypothetical protein